MRIFLIYNCTYRSAAAISGWFTFHGRATPVLERYYRELLNFCARMVRDRDAAADLVQESYARVLAVRNAGQEIPEPRALLHQTARR